MLSVDSGTWPTGGGGVGSCRRDLIDNLNRVRWTAVAEIGTDSEMVQKGYQVYCISFVAPVLGGVQNKGYRFRLG